MIIASRSWKVTYIDNYSGVSNNCRAYNYCFLRFFLGLQPCLGAYIYWFLAFFQGIGLNIFSVEVFDWNEKLNKKGCNNQVFLKYGSVIWKLCEFFKGFAPSFVKLFQTVNLGPMHIAFQVFQGL